MTEQYLSVMCDLIPDHKKGGVKLHLGLVSNTRTLPSFDAFESAVMGLRGTHDMPKMTHAGYIPSRFRPHVHPKRPWSQIRTWRTGGYENDAISCLVCDVDNEQDHQPKATWSDIVAMNVRAFGYDSFSGSVSNPRFRVVIETDRHMTRVETRKVMAWVNNTYLNQQSDMSMADKAHYAIVADHRARHFQTFGEVLNVDNVLTACDYEIQNGCPYLSIAAFTRSVIAPPSIGSGMVAKTVNTQQLNNHMVTSNNVTDWICQDDINEYMSGLKPHWQTMFVVLQREFKRSGGLLTQGDMSLIADHLDSFAGNYFLSKYGSDELDRRITDAMSVPVITRINNRFGKQRQ